LEIRDCEALLSRGRGAEDFVPPPRFADKRFASWRADPEIAGQEAAVGRIRSWVDAIPARRPWYRLVWRDRVRGLYLDGDFGVGKTHLLAAAYHRCRGSARYLAFSEAMSSCVVRGVARTVEILAGRLVCIDEFELDDPSNTRLADLLLADLAARGTRVMVTSNTVPGELGEGRMSVDRFRDQLTRIGGRFDSCHVPGHDFRRRDFRDPGDLPGWGDPPAFPPGTDELDVDVERLDAFLRKVPIVDLRRVAAALPALSLRGLDRFDDQLAALRFVHFVDRLYDHAVPVRVEARREPDGIFHPDYRDWAFAKKFRRCTSRLIEMCEHDPRGAAASGERRDAG